METMATVRLLGEVISPSISPFLKLVSKYYCLLLGECERLLIGIILEKTGASLYLGLAGKEFCTTVALLLACLSLKTDQSTNQGSTS